MMRKPVIAITAGDPTGIGPEVTLKALAAVRRSASLRIVVIGDLRVFQDTARRLRRRLPPWRVWQPGGNPLDGQVPLTFLDCANRIRFVPGRSSAQAGAASLAYLRHALLLWRARRLDALVTAPVTKWAVARVEPRFIGHTEYLADAMACRSPVMMFVSERLRVALLTRHLPLRRVPQAIDAGVLRRSLRLTEEALRKRFGIHHPRIAVCGINPHAGEAGRCGREEQTVMDPVLRALRRSGLRCEGPFAADGLFGAGTARYDAIVCPYHDQGLIPFKMASRDQGCQLTIGLPIVRTSPDHGSALDIAGRGIADPGSMRYALELAVRLTEGQSQK